MPAVTQQSTTPVKALHQAFASRHVMITHHGDFDESDLTLSVVPAEPNSCLNIEVVIQVAQATCVVTRCQWPGPWTVAPPTTLPTVNRPHEQTIVPNLPSWQCRSCYLQLNCHYLLLTQRIQRVVYKRQVCGVTTADGAELCPIRSKHLNTTLGASVHCR